MLSLMLELYVRITRGFSSETDFLDRAEHPSWPID